MRIAVLLTGLLIAGSTREAIGETLSLYEGSWNTTRFKKLDGTIRAQVKPLAKDRWQGRFWGVWQQVPFDYTVEFAAANGDNEKGTAQRVRGTATIDGAHYDWVGDLTPGRFDVQFTGSRYEGGMALKRLADQRSQN